MNIEIYTKREIEKLIFKQYLKLQKDLFNELTKMRNLILQLQEENKHIRGLIK